MQTLPREVVANTVRTFHTSVTLDRPRLWQPGRPYLYPTIVAAGTDGVRRSSYRLRLGVKKLEVVKGGIIELNGHPVNLRGASIHEDDVNTGAVIDHAHACAHDQPAQGRRRQPSRARTTRSTRASSRRSTAPASSTGSTRRSTSCPTPSSTSPGIRAAAKRAVRLTVLNNVNHASIMTWALANEPAGNRSELGVIGNGLARYIKDGAAEVR